MKIRYKVSQSKNTVKMKIYVGSRLKSSLEIDDEKQRVIMLLVMGIVEKRKYTKLQIARSLVGLGSYTRFEQPQKNTTVRKVHKILRDFRLEGIPIVSDTDGTWLATHVSEVDEFCDIIKRKAVSDYKAGEETRKALIMSVA